MSATPASTTSPPPSATADGAWPRSVAVQNSANTGTRYMNAAVRLTEGSRSPVTALGGHDVLVGYGRVGALVGAGL